MNKKLSLASALFVASAVFAFETWYGDIYQVETGLGTDTNTYGYWFSYNDNEDGGKSEVVWPVAIGTEYSDTSLDPVIDHCYGICGTAVLDKGTLTYNPFAGIGFNVVGAAVDGGDPIPGDATAWGGLCITYASAAAPTLELGLGDFDSKIGYANPAVSLPMAASARVTKALPWSSFAQPSWYNGSTKISGEEAAKQLVSVKFKIQNTPGEYPFYISMIGPYTDGWCQPYGIDKAVRGPSNAKATLLGRNLGVSGIISSAAVEITNLHGQVVTKGSINNGSTLDLSSLDAGIYMVHVTGTSVNFVDKIVLK